MHAYSPIALQHEQKDTVLLNEDALLIRTCIHRCSLCMCKYSTQVHSYSQWYSRSSTCHSHCSTPSGPPTVSASASPQHASPPAPQTGSLQPKHVTVYSIHTHVSPQGHRRYYDYRMMLHREAHHAGVFRNSILNGKLAQCSKTSTLPLPLLYPMFSPCLSTRFATLSECNILVTCLGPALLVHSKLLTGHTLKVFW